MEIIFLNPAKARVVVAMSGGVDSSVAAALLLEQGYEVIGMMMRLWSEPGTEIYNRCCTPEAMSLARRVAAHLGIPFYAVDAQSVFRDSVVTYFIDGYTHGNTPNPCLTCNRYIRWEFLLNRALALGADFMATGHYARLDRSETSAIHLLRALDRNKDQSYILHILGQEQLAHAIFPLGELTKPDVRSLARQLNLPVADRPESQDLCFLGQGNYRQFLKRNAPEVQSTGQVVDTSGNILAEHDGLAFYTIGQRKGLGLSSPQPLYVIAKDIQNNTLIVGPQEALGKCDFDVVSVNWIDGIPPVQPIRLQVKIRYKAQEIWGTVTARDGGNASIRLEKPARDITPGQAAVFYDGEICLGGGIIKA
jgi:tRNA-uridine 2-sulfurtransferase